MGRDLTAILFGEKYELPRERVAARVDAKLFDAYVGEYEFVAADCKSVQLRAERAGNGDGRVYTITLKVADASGNVRTATAKVAVPIASCT